MAHTDKKQMHRLLYVVRHAEREDNINRQWQKLHPNFSRDNSPLSKRGHSQAQDLQKYFQDIPIDQIYVSPFTRTMETASTLLDGNHPNSINVEPGLCEALYLCTKPPGFFSVQKLKEEFPRVNTEYSPICPSPLPKEGMGDEACIPRLRKTINGVLDQNPDSRMSLLIHYIGCLENIVLVSHGAAIAAIFEVLCSDFTYVGQATVSIFEETKPNSGKFKLLQSSGTSHLSAENRHNLRAY